MTLLHNFISSWYPFNLGCSYLFLGPLVTIHAAATNILRHICLQINVVERRVQDRLWQALKGLASLWKRKQWKVKYSTIRKLISCKTGCASILTKLLGQRRLVLRSQPSSPSVSTSVTTSANIASSPCLAPHVRRLNSYFSLRNHHPEPLLEFDFLLELKIEVPHVFLFVWFL